MFGTGVSITETLVHQKKHIIKFLSLEAAVGPGREQTEIYLTDSVTVCRGNTHTHTHPK